MRNFQEYFSRTFQDLKLQFGGTLQDQSDFPGPGILKKKIQDFPGGMGTLHSIPRKSARFSGLGDNRSGIRKMDVHGSKPAETEK